MKAPTHKISLFSKALLDSNLLQISTALLQNYFGWYIFSFPTTLNYWTSFPANFNSVAFPSPFVLVMDYIITQATIHAQSKIKWLFVSQEQAFCLKSFG